MTDDPNDQSYPIHAAEAERQFARKLEQLVKATSFCLAENLWEPFLILMYSAIDAMAWLDRPAEHADVTPPDFVNWVNAYLLPDSGLTCTAEDMYGARCGLLHSHTGESKRHRELKIKKLFYRRLWQGKPLLLLQLRMNEKFFPATVNLDQMAVAFERALQRFTQALDADNAKSRLVTERIVQSYLTEVQRL